MNPAQRAAESAGPPVNPLLGAHVLAGKEDLDFTLEGPLPLSWQRYYRSNSTEVGWFGQGWGSSLEVRLEARSDPTGSYVDRVDCVDIYGRHIEFPVLAAGKSFLSVAEKMTLSRTAQGQYRLDTEDGYSYWFRDRSGQSHRLATLTDRNGNAIQLSYVETGSELLVIHVACSGGQHLELIFQASRLRQVLERRESGGVTHRVQLMRYVYNPQGDLSAVYNRANECMRSFAYNADRLIDRLTYAGTFEAWYQYAGAGSESKVIRHWDNVGQSWTFDYHAKHTAVTDQDGRVSLHHFDQQHRRTGYTDALGQFTRYGLDLDGNLRFLIDPAENVTETVFDERGSPIEVRNPAGAVTKIEWDPVLKRPVAIEDALHRVHRYGYDARGNKVLQVLPDGAETHYEVDTRGLPVTIIDANGGTTRLKYNAAAQVVSHTDCSQQTTLFAYDENGFLSAEIDALGQRTSYTHDAVGRLRRIDFADGSHETYESDLADRQLSVANSLGFTKLCRYAPDGLLLEVVDALGHTRRQRYNSSRELAELINENGSSYRFAYDALGRLVAESGFDGVQRRYAYDAASRLVATVDAPGSNEEIETRFEWDAAGRMVRLSTKTGVSVFTYDAAGQLATARNHATEVKFKRDLSGRVLDESISTLGETHALAHSYDPLGNRLDTRIDGATRLSTLYYGSGHAHRISLDDEPLTDFERDALHRETSRTQGRLLITRHYNAVDQLKAQVTVAPDAGELAPLGRRYAYDPARRLIETLEPAGTLVHGYDAIDRMTRFRDEHFAFDPAHNMVPAAHLPDAAGSNVTATVVDNRLTAYGNRRYHHDVHGRIVHKTIGSEVSIGLTWNDEHQLVESRTSDADGNRETRYIYDPFGRRVAKIGPTGTTRFMWDGLQLLQEWNGSQRRLYVHEPDAQVPLAQVVTSTAQDAPAQVYYYHCDQAGLPRELTDPLGRIAWQASYHGWGALREVHACAAIQPLRYQGQYFDDETGFHYNLSRYYDPECGRFMSPDPVGLRGGLNEYQYAVNPTGWIDLWGLTGTYIMSGGAKRNYAGKGPAGRSQVSKKARLKGCPKTVLVHKDYGDDEMAFMVEELVMVKYSAVTSPNWANAINSPGKKKLAANPAKKAAAQKNADDLIAEFEKEKAACGL